MYKLSRKIFILFIPVILSAQDIEVYFSPKGDCKQAILGEIKKARVEILVAMYTLTEEELALALVDAKKMGIDVKIILDKRQSKGKYSKAGAFAKGDVLIRYGGEKGLFHHKFAVLDSSTVITGSFNWTKSAEERNNENLLIIHSYEIAKIYRKEFLTLWKEPIVICSKAFKKQIGDSIEIKGDLSAWLFLKSTKEYDEFIKEQGLSPLNIAKYFDFNLWEIACGGTMLRAPTNKRSFWYYFIEEWKEFLRLE